MPQSNFDLIWTQEQKKQAADEGWELGIVIDMGKPVSTAYLDVFDKGPKFKDRSQAARFVLAQAHSGSRLHINALSARAASRMPAGAPKKKAKA